MKICNMIPPKWRSNNRLAFTFIALYRSTLFLSIWNLEDGLIRLPQTLCPLSAPVRLHSTNSGLSLSFESIIMSRLSTLCRTEARSCQKTRKVCRHRQPQTPGSVVFFTPDLPQNRAWKPTSVASVFRMAAPIAPKFCSYRQASMNVHIRER